MKSAPVIEKMKRGPAGLLTVLAQRPTYRMSEILRNRGIAHHLDDWGPEGGHEWPQLPAIAPQ